MFAYKKIFLSMVFACSVINFQSASGSYNTSCSTTYSQSQCIGRGTWKNNCCYLSQAEETGRLPGDAEIGEGYITDDDESDEPGTSGNNCEPVPDCSAIGFAYTSAQCGSLKKLKCPFDDVHYFCSKSDCNQVTYNSTTQYCTKYCADVDSMCVEAAYKTCDATDKTGLFASNNGVGTLHTANSTISSSTSNYITGKHYLLGPVTLSSPTYYGTDSGYFQNAYIYNAGLSYPNNCESSMSDTPKLSGYVTLSGHNYFDVDVDFKNVYYTPSNRWGASFLGNTNLSINYHPQSNWANEITIDFEGRDYGSPTTNKLCIILDNNNCQNMNWGNGNCVGTYRSELTVSIASYNANVKYYIQGGQSQYIHVSCDNESSGSSCTEDYSACDDYY